MKQEIMTQNQNQNQNQGDNQDEAGKLFVGGLSWETSQENLQQYFSRYGEVVDCVVMKNNETGRSRGFGFVTFKDPSCVALVLSSGPHELDGRTIDPKACSPRGTHKANPNKKAGNYPKVFLGGLPSACTETDIRSFFSKYGRVMEVVIMYDQEKKKSRGFGFLSFETEDSVKQVCAEHFVTINGKQVECKRAEPRDLSRGNRTGQQQNANMAPNQWGPGMGMGPGPGGWGPGPGGPGMGPGGPGMGGAPGPMGPPMANGMMPGGYQGGWGGPQQQGPYGPQTGWGPQPPAGGYGTGYQGWGAPPGGFGPYGGPGPQFGQQGYGGYGAPGYGGYGGFGGPMGNAPSGPPGTQPPGTDGYSGPGNNPSGQGGPPGGNTAGPNAPQGMGNYPQEASNFGPARGYGGGMDGMQNYMGGQGFGGQGTGYSGQGDGPGPQGARGAGQAQGYHPYRR